MEDHYHNLARVAPFTGDSANDDSLLKLVPFLHAVVNRGGDVREVLSRWALPEIVDVGTAFSARSPTAVQGELSALVSGKPLDGPSRTNDAAVPAAIGANEPTTSHESLAGAPPAPAKGDATNHWTVLGVRIW